MVTVTILSGNIIMDLGIILFFTVFSLTALLLIIAFLALNKKQEYKTYTPKVTVMIPAYNEEKRIQNCLQAILNNNYKNLEILCIDDGSTDDTRNIIQQLAKENKQITLLKANHKGKTAALNLGVKRAKHDIIISIDADTYIHKNFISEVVKPFQNKEVGATNGMALVHRPRTIMERFQNVEYHSNNLIRKSFSKLFNNGIWFFGAAAAYRKSAIQEVGLFSKEVLTEDMDMMLRLLKAKYQVLSLEKATYYTVVPKNIFEFLKQRMRWFYGGLQCITKHKSLVKRKSFAIRYLFFNQAFWSFYSLLIIPLVIYQVNFWLPETGIFWYIFRWFSLAGPAMVLYKIPEWGLNFINIFGILAAVLTTALLLIATAKKINLGKLIIMFFYFPFTLLLNVSLILSLLKYPFQKQKGFVK